MARCASKWCQNEADDGLYCGFHAELSRRTAARLRERLGRDPLCADCREAARAASGQEQASAEGVQDE